MDIVAIILAVLVITIIIVTRAVINGITADVVDLGTKGIITIVIKYLFLCRPLHILYIKNQNLSCKKNAVIQIGNYYFY